MLASSKSTRTNQKGAAITHPMVALVIMSFSYLLATTFPTPQPLIDYPRLLISDTQEFAADGTTPIYIFNDSEILGAGNIEISVWQSPQFFSGPMGVAQLGSTPVPYRRIAATLLDGLAANKARLAAVQQILDVKLSPEKAAQALMAQAAALRKADDESGSFVVIEQVNDVFSFRDRYWKSVQRQFASGPLG